MAEFAIAEDARVTEPARQKPKKPPPITPRRFTKFFTPRFQNARRAVRTSRAALQDITTPAINRAKLDLELSSRSPRKRRRLSFSSPNSSLQSSPLRRSNLPHNGQELPETYTKTFGRGEEELSTVGEEDETDIEVESRPGPRARIQQYKQSNPSASRLSWRISGHRSRSEPRDSSIWQHHAANFCTVPGDVYTSGSYESPVLSLPFCVASCNTNSLVAIGQEDGAVRVVDSALKDRPGFCTAYLSMKPHDNAIMDLAFSFDDSLLATASGDQTAQVIDMQSQKSLFCLSGHSSSTKQVQFQPGSGNNVLATCSRDGCVNLWDLRYRTIDRPSFHLRSSGRAGSDRMTAGMRYASIINSIREAHAVPQKPRKSNFVAQSNRPLSVSGRNEFSVTSLSFLGTTRPHLLVTTSEVDAVVRLWDMRTTYSSRRGKPVPLSCTQEPKSHESHRHFGVTSLALSSDGARLYTLCRDHTVYAYATSHLVVGSATELSTRSSRSFRPADSVGHGLGPLYGLRHPQLRVSTFYPKLAVRPTTAKDMEVLAVGSSDDCAVIFPTDERYMTRLLSNCQRGNDLPSSLSSSISTTFPGLKRTNSFTHSLQLSCERDAGVAMYHHGTPLIRGHYKEVTALAWTHEGSLVTASDDFSVRCWREDASRARQLRTKGEGEGGRWGCGWADVSPQWDEDD